MSDTKDMTGKSFTVEDLEDAVKKALSKPLGSPILMIPPNVVNYFNNNYYAELEEKKKNFEALFHKGVVLKHKGSKVTWTIESTFENYHTHERRCRIRSEKGYTKELNRDQVNHYEVTEIPEAVKILFSQKNEQI